MAVIFGPKTREEKDELLKTYAGFPILIIHQPEEIVIMTEHEFGFLITVFGGAK